MRASDKRYKDEKRHGGKRGELLALFGPRCSACGHEGGENEIVAHHIRGNPLDHSLQILLCRSCHASLHMDGTDKKPVKPSHVREAIGSTDTLEDAASKVGLSRSVLLERRKRFGIGKPCRHCLVEFMPTPKLRHYCSDSCAKEGKKSALLNYRLRNRERIKAQCKKDYSRHREKRLESCKKYYATNAERIKAYSREWHRKRKSNQVET